MNGVTLVPFQPKDQKPVKKLILDGLVEHWGVLDPSKNLDLDDIATSYQRGYFLVAWLEGQIVGTGALIPHTDETGEIVRMSVASDVRRIGIGTLILQKIIKHARTIGYKRIILETTETWQEVVAFYLRNGFQITHYTNGDVYFVLELAKH
jgi:GNAT superfamily N-acetyltransferase